MKLVLAIVSNDDASAVTSALTKNNFYMTRLSTTGGFLRAGNTTLIVGTDDDLVDKCIDVIGSEAKRRTEIVPSTASYECFFTAIFHEIFISIYFCTDKSLFKI